MTDIAAGSIRPLAPKIPLDRGPVLVAGGSLILGAIVISQLIDVRPNECFVDETRVGDLVVRVSPSYRAH